MEQYYEQSVLKTPSNKMKLYVVLVWTAAILGTIGALVLSAIYILFEIGLFVCMFFIMAAMLFQKRSKGEYEYIFADGTFTADKIQNKSRRFSVTKFEVPDVLEFGRYNKVVRSTHKASYIYDQSIEGGDPWFFYYYVNNKKALLVFEPDAQMLDLIKDSLPIELRHTAFEQK